eukprot:Gb_03396 [translate_table: standard]
MRNDIHCHLDDHMGQSDHFCNVHWLDPHDCLYPEYALHTGHHCDQIHIGHHHHLHYGHSCCTDHLHDALHHLKGIL